MADRDTEFGEAMPQVYKACLVPAVFAPYAEDLAVRIEALRPRRILELAAGTGVLTQAVSLALPEASITATDLAAPMVSAAWLDPRPLVHYEQADANDLRYPDGAFDLVACQFGVMFFPDRVGSYRQVRSVLAEGGNFLFSSWGSIADNPVAETLHDAVGYMFPDDPPQFVDAVPHGHHDPDVIRSEVQAAGFSSVEVELVRLRTVATSARQLAVGFVTGTPLRNAIEDRDPARLGAVVDAVEHAMVERFGSGEVDAPAAAYVISASK